MALKRYSAFNYGHTVTRNNKYLNFKEPFDSALEKTTIIDIGAYTLTQMGDKVAQALNSAGLQEYTVTLDRNTRKFTITAPAVFELLITSGTHNTLSVFNLLGFNGADLAGANTYTGDSASGSQYITQSPVKNFSDFKHNKEKAEAVVKTTPSGLTEVISYSTLERMKCDMPLITNYLPQRFIRGSATGVEEAEAFMDYITTKAPIEFMEDYTLQGNYTPCLLDKTRESSKGVGYELKEKVRDSLPGYYELMGHVYLKIEV